MPLSAYHKDAVVGACAGAGPSMLMVRRSICSTAARAAEHVLGNLQRMRETPAPAKAMRCWRTSTPATPGSNGPGSVSWKKLGFWLLDLGLRPAHGRPRGDHGRVLLVPPASAPAEPATGLARAPQGIGLLPRSRAAASMRDTDLTGTEGRCRVDL